MFYGSFHTWNSMVTLIFTFDLSSGRVQVKKGQILKIVILSFISESFCLRISKSYFFVVRQFAIPRIDFKKLTSLPLLGYWATSQPKIKTFPWNFEHMLVAHSSIIYSVFYFWNFSFLGIYFWKAKLCFSGLKKKQKIENPT